MPKEWTHYVMNYRMPLYARKFPLPLNKTQPVSSIAMNATVLFLYFLLLLKNFAFSSLTHVFTLSDVRNLSHFVSLVWADSISGVKVRARDRSKWIYEFSDATEVPHHTRTWGLLHWVLRGWTSKSSVEIIQSFNTRNWTIKRRRIEQKKTELRFWR